jgi:hypothetical protein
VTVNDLADLVAQVIAAGRGDDQVFVNLDQSLFDARAKDVLDAHNWEAYDLNLNDGRSGFIGLNASPDRP